MADEKQQQPDDEFMNSQDNKQSEYDKNVKQITGKAVKKGVAVPASAYHNIARQNS